MKRVQLAIISAFLIFLIGACDKEEVKTPADEAREELVAKNEGTITFSNQSSTLTTEQNILINIGAYCLEKSGSTYEFDALDSNGDTIKIYAEEDVVIAGGGTVNLFDYIDADDDTTYYYYEYVSGTGIRIHSHTNRNSLINGESVTSTDFGLNVGDTIMQYPAGSVQINVSTIDEMINTGNLTDYCEDAPSPTAFAQVEILVCDCRDACCTSGEMFNYAAADCGGDPKDFLSFESDGKRYTSYECY